MKKQQFEELYALLSSSTFDKGKLAKKLQEEIGSLPDEYRENLLKQITITPMKGTPAKTYKIHITKVFSPDSNPYVMRDEYKIDDKEDVMRVYGELINAWAKWKNSIYNVSPLVDLGNNNTVCLEYVTSIVLDVE